jgi:hypothetical protein
MGLISNLTLIADECNALSNDRIRMSARLAHGGISVEAETRDGQDCACMIFTYRVLHDVAAVALRGEVRGVFVRLSRAAGR